MFMVLAVLILGGSERYLNIPSTLANLIITALFSVGSHSRGNRLGHDKGCGPCCLEVEATRHSVDVEHFACEIEVWTRAALKGGRVNS